MNPQAIMTPGGIADQFTRGLSGVAQAFAQRSAIDRQAQQDAFSRARALENDRMAREAFARQQTWRDQDQAIRQDQELRAAKAFELSQIQANPDAYPDHPLAQQIIRDRQNRRVTEAFKYGSMGGGGPASNTDIMGGQYPIKLALSPEEIARTQGRNVFDANQVTARQRLEGGGYHLDERMAILEKVQRDREITKKEEQINKLIGDIGGSLPANVPKIEAQIQALRQELAALRSGGRPTPGLVGGGQNSAPSEDDVLRQLLLPSK